MGDNSIECRNRLFPLDRNGSLLNETIKDMYDVKITMNPYGENVALTTYNAIQDFISRPSLSSK